MAGDESIATRTGHYIHQPTANRAFNPVPLPPAPIPVLTGKLQHLHSDADRALGRLDGFVLTLPNPDVFVVPYAHKKAVLSSQIEGTQSSTTPYIALSRDADPLAPEAGGVKESASVRQIHVAQNWAEILFASLHMVKAASIVPYSAARGRKKSEELDKSHSKAEHLAD